MIQRKIFFLVCILFSVWFLNGCENTFDPISSSNNPTGTVLQAIIGLNDNPLVSDRTDSVLTNQWTVISSIYSTGNIMRREWKVYRVRNGALILTDTATFLSQTFTTPDTLLYKLKVFGYGGPSDTSSTRLTLRILTSFGIGSSGDISLWDYANGNYKILLPYGRIPLSVLNNPKWIGSLLGWNNPTPLTDSVVGRGYLVTINVPPHTVVEFNYLAGANIWSNAVGSMYKTPGSANTYSIEFINGNIYPINGGPSFIIPGMFGDTVSRYDATVDSLIFYPNHRWIPSPMGTPWIELNLFGFATRYQAPYGDTGYGRIAVPLSLVRGHQNQIKFRFGGNLPADMTHSPIYSAGYLNFQFVSPRPAPEPWQTGDKIKVIGPNGSLIQEIIVKKS